MFQFFANKVPIDKYICLKVTETLLANTVDFLSVFSNLWNTSTIMDLNIQIS